MGIVKIFDGHKTQIGAVAALVVGLCVTRGWIPADVAQVLLSIVGIWTGISIAHHEAKKEKGK